MPLICLQGGSEFTPGCRDMDAAVLRQVASGPGPVRTVLVALAAAPGREHEQAVANGVRYYESLGADAVAAPDARDHADAAVAAVEQAALVVLAGGSPARLLHGLRQTGVGDALIRAWGRGCAVSGASAGAMVLGGWTVLPERPGAPAVVPALALVPDVVVVPHWRGRSSGAWLPVIRAAAPGATILGLPERSGVLVVGGRVTATGRHPVELVGRGTSLHAGQSVALP